MGHLYSSHDTWSLGHGTEAITVVTNQALYYLGEQQGDS